MKTKELISEISDLPTKEQTKIAEWILKTLNPVHPDIDQAWAAEARRRLQKFEEGQMEAIPGEQVHRELRKKYVPLH